MAKRTILRQANTQEISNISEKMFSAYEFSGINDSDNYTDVDQFSFADADNVYNDGDGRLSTRPPLKTIVMQDFDVNDVKYVQKVDDVVFYITDDNIIHWRYNDAWNVCECYDYVDISIISYDDYYLIFTRNDIGVVSLKAVRYNYDTKVFDEYSTDELIYVPITTVHYGATDTDMSESKNLLTSSYREEYIFNIDITTPSSDIIGETVTIRLGDDTYEVVWDETIPDRLCKHIGNIRVSQDQSIEFDHVKQNDLGLYFAWFDSPDDEHAYAIYSVDGNVWGKISYPSNFNSSMANIFTYTDNGYTVWFYNTIFDNDGTTSKVYYITVSTNVSNYSVWSEIDFDIFMDGTEFMKTMSKDVTTGNVTYAESYRFVRMKYEYANEASAAYESYAKRNICMHASEDGEFVLVFTVSTRLLRRSLSVNTNAYVHDNILDNDNGVEYDVMEPEASYNRDDMVLVTCKNYQVTSSNVYYDRALDTYSSSLSKFIYYQPTDQALSIALLGWYVRTNTQVVNYLYELHLTAIIFDGNMKPYKWVDEEFDLSATQAGALYADIPLYVNNNDDDDDDVYIYTDVIGLGSKFKCNLINGVYNILGFYYQFTGDISSRDLSNKDSLTLYTSTSNIAIESAYLNNMYRFTEFSGTIYAKDYTSIDALTSEPCKIYGDVTYKDVYNRGNYNNVYANEDVCLSDVYDNSMDNCYVLTDGYWYVNGVVYDYLDIYSHRIKHTVNITTDGYITFVNNNNEIYSNYFDDDWYVDYMYKGSDTLIIPSFIDAFITHTFVYNNLLYQTNTVTIEDDGGLLYIPENTKVTLPDTVTGTVVFSQTVLALFTEHTAYEYAYDDENGYFMLYPTKLQLGNRKDYDICTAFDGLTIYLSTVFGYKSLTYESFIQSTEQAFTDCCENIYNKFIAFDDAPIKQAKYNYWIFLYKQGSTEVLVYDTRANPDDYYNPTYPKWFHWTLPCNIEQIYYDDRNCYVFTGDTVYLLDFTSLDVVELGKPITWFIRSQRLHFSYPAYYKHISTFSILTSQGSDVRYNLKFINYHNAFDTEHTDTREYEVETIGTCIKRVNFIKTNALQFEISNDDTDDKPEKFAISGINIKYRVTENVR